MTGKKGGSPPKTRDILLVDDNEDDLILCERALKKEGYQVHCVSSGPEALKYVKQHPDVALIVLDINMAELNGIETLQRLRKINRGLPVVLFSNYPEYRLDFQTWLADAYLMKKYDFTELIETIRRLLSAGRDK
jgi:CheY-like chemotaxis protein